MRRQVIRTGSRPPWIGLSAAVWVEIASGNAYNFPLYSHALKSALNYTQQQLTLLGVANDVGESVAFLPGYANSILPPWMVLLIGACTCFFGYGLIWLSVTHTLPPLPFWWLWIALIVASNSCAWLGTTVLITNMMNFPFSKGTVAGILKGYAAIGGAIYTVIFNRFLNKSSTNLLMFLALGIPVICLATMNFIRPCAPASGENSSFDNRFLFTQVTAFFAALIVLIITFAGSSISASVANTLVCLVGLLLVCPFAIPIQMSFSRTRPVRIPNPNAESAEGLNQEEVEESIEIEDEDASDVQTLIAEGGALESRRRRPRRREDLRLRDAFIRADFWLLWFLYLFGIGSGVTVLNNLAQIGIAVGNVDTTILLCIFSFSNFLGRLISGAISEYFVKSIAMPRTVWMTLSQILMVLAFILYGFSTTATLYPATALLGLSYGSQYALTVPTVSELFGLQHFGTIYSCMILGNPIGAVFFSSFVAGHLYDAEAKRQGSSTCDGPECFRLTFVILGCLCGVATILGVILSVRTRLVYRTLSGSRTSGLPQD